MQANLITGNCNDNDERENERCTRKKYRDKFYTSQPSDKVVKRHLHIGGIVGMFVFPCIIQTIISFVSFVWSYSLYKSQSLSLFKIFGMPKLTQTKLY